MTTQEVGLRCENFVVEFKVEARRAGPLAAALQCPPCLWGPFRVARSVCMGILWICCKKSFRLFYLLEVVITWKLSLFHRFPQGSGRGQRIC